MGEKELTKTAWEKAVFERAGGRCSNCHSDKKLHPRMVVPPELGGKMIETNGVLLCRSCEMALDSKMRGKKGEDRRSVDFWISRKLYESVQTTIETKNGFHGMGELVRYLISKFLTNEPRFDDLEMYQDDGSDVKVNVWVDNGSYGSFKEILTKRGTSVTDAVKGLLLMYQSEAAPVIRSSKTAS